MGWFGFRKHGESEIVTDAPGENTSVFPPPPPWAATVDTGGSKRKRSWRPNPPKWLTRTLLTIGIVLLVFVAAVAAYDRTQSDVLMPGASIDLISVGSMSTAEATEMLSARLDESQSHQLTLDADGETLTLTLADLGLHADVQGAVDTAHAGVSGDGIVATLAGPFTRSWHRIFNKPVDLDIELEYEFDEGQVREHADALAGQVHRDMRNAEIDVSGGTFEVVGAEAGRALNTDEFVALAKDNARDWALAKEAIGADVPVQVIEPEITTEGLGTSLFVNRASRRVWVYQNGDQQVDSFPIAIGSAAYPTPRGWFEVTMHRPNPTWVNPDPTGWGAGMPKSIPPGPNSPLGRYAININASGIRFHEGPNVGAAASHGCMRMHLADVKKLADYAPVGTRVVIT